MDKLLKSSIAHMLDGYVLHEAVFDAAGRMVDYRYRAANPAALRILGKAEQDLVGRTATECFPGLVERGTMAWQAEVMASGAPALLRDYAYEADGVEKRFDISCFRIDGRHFVSIFRDVTTERAQEESLRRTGEHLALALRAAKAGTWRRDLRTGAIEWSPELRAILGVPPSARASVEAFRSLLHPEDRDATSVLAEASLTDGQPRSCEYRIVRPDGRVAWIASSSGPGDPDPQGRPQSLHGVCLDISDIKETEQRLRQAEKMEALGRLVGGVAHDVNNQLAAIQAFAEQIQSRVAPGDAAGGYARDIQTVVRMSAGVTASLLAFSRKGRCRLEVVDLHRLLHEVVQILQHSLEKRIGLRLDLEARDARVDGDAGQLFNAVLNLALNARDAIIAGRASNRGDIAFLTRNVELADDLVSRHGIHVAPGRYLCLTVQDTGAGMDEETASRLFEPFFTTKAPGKGTGLGLAAVRGIVVGHKGGVTVQSRPGAGSSFTVYLPVSQAAAPAATAPAGVPPGAKGRILVVDDEEMLLRSLASGLKDAGHAVEAFTDGERAVEHYRHHWREVDLVLLDWIMPGLSGREVFLSMKTVNPGVRALLMSGLLPDGEDLELQGLGFRGLLEKPFTLATLDQRISLALRDGAPEGPDGRLSGRKPDAPAARKTRKAAKASKAGKPRRRAARPADAT